MTYTISLYRLGRADEGATWISEPLGRSVAWRLARSLTQAGVPYRLTRTGGPIVAATI